MFNTVPTPTHQLAIDALDKKFGPMWPRAVNLATLDISSLSDCIVIQVIRHQSGTVPPNAWTDTVHEMFGPDHADWNTPDSDTNVINFFASNAHLDEWKDYLMGWWLDRANEGRLHAQDADSIADEIL